MPYERLVRVVNKSPDKQTRDTAFSELMRRFEPMVMYHTNRTMGEPDKAENVAQNKLYRPKRRVRSTGSWPNSNRSA